MSSAYWRFNERIFLIIIYEEFYKNFRETHSFIRRKEFLTCERIIIKFFFWYSGETSHDRRISGGVGTKIPERPLVLKFFLMELVMIRAHPMILTLWDLCSKVSYIELGLQVVNLKQLEIDGVNWQNVTLK